MKMLKISTIICFLIGAVTVQAQNNLVPNSSFEQTEKKVKSGEGEIALALPWNSTDEENPADLYSKDCKKGYGVPENDRGYMDPDDGGNYAGFRAFSYRDKLPRTYLQVKLTKPLIAGKKYCVQFKVALSKTSKYASNNIGMHFGVKKPKQKEIDANAIKPQIVNAGNKMLDDRHVWQTVCGVFIAQGNERYVTIGNFTPSADMEDKKDYKKMNKLKEFPQLQTVDAYYLIDEVSVINLEEIDVCNCDAEDDGGNEMKVVIRESTSDDMNKSASERLEVKNVFFEKGNTEPASALALEAVLEILNENPDLNIEVVGHMDAVEQKENIKDISAERAKVVYEYLIENGIDASRLSYKGVKSTQPLDEGGTRDAQAKNRRVSFEVK